jgi:hypothetical protein
VAQYGVTSKDLGLKNILKEVKKLKSMCVKVGVTEDVGSQKPDGGDATLAQIAYWNEYGVMNKDNTDWFIPPRPFIHGWANAKRELIAKTQDMLGDLVMSGKLDAHTAIRQLGEFGMNRIKSYIEQDGSFRENAKSTKARKDSHRPLIDQGTLHGSIRFQPIEKPVDEVSES